MKYTGIIILLTLTSFTSLFAQQDTVITIYGKKFAPGAEVFFNGRKLDNVERISSRELRVRIPFSILSTQITAIGKTAAAISSAEPLLAIQDSITVRNPSPSRGYSNGFPLTIVASEARRLGDFLGKWKQKNIKLFIHNQTPREVISEIAVAVRAFNQVLDTLLFIDLDTVNLVSQRPTLVTNYTPDGKNVIGMIESNEFPGQSGPIDSVKKIYDGIGAAFPPTLRDLTTTDKLQPAQNRIFQEYDIAMNKTEYDKMSLKRGQIPESDRSRNLTWAIAHEIGHFLGLAHTYSILDDWRNALMKVNTSPKDWLGIPERESTLLKNWYK